MSRWLMSMRYHIARHPETVQDLELASGDRLFDGMELLMAGRSAGGVYMLGYVAEMVLKGACFLFDGARPSDEVSPRLGPMRIFGKRHFPSVRPDNYHSIAFWYRVLLHKRRLAGRPLPTSVVRELGRRVRCVHGMWTVSMRYYPAGLFLSSDSIAVYNDVVWIYDHRGRLGV